MQYESASVCVVEETVANVMEQPTATGDELVTGWPIQIGLSPICRLSGCVNCCNVSALPRCVRVLLMLQCQTIWIRSNSHTSTNNEGARDRKLSNASHLLRACRLQSYLGRDGDSRKFRERYCSWCLADSKTMAHKFQHLEELSRAEFLNS